MKISHKTGILLSALLLVFSLGNANAAGSKCISPEETVTQFYHWYLGEIKNEKYPLTPTYKGDKTRLTKWIATSLLKELQDPQSQGEMDFDYFTYAQDFFDSWLEHISTKRVFQRDDKSEVKLSLGIDDELNVYTINLDDENCWKIKSVKSDR